MLNGRSTTLKYNGHVSKPIKLDNRIGQGNLLSMVLYQFYNVNLLDISKGKCKDALVYIDNTIIIASLCRELHLSAQEIRKHDMQRRRGLEVV